MAAGCGRERERERERELSFIQHVFPQPDCGSCYLNDIKKLTVAQEVKKSLVFYGT
jgi:hypothetical protein